MAAGAAAAVRSGHARWLTLRAMPGMGRTTLLEETVRRETADGAMAARVVHCTSAESTYPFSLVRRLLPDAGQDVPFTEQPPADEQHTFHRLGARLERIARRQPLLLAVDDLHDADEVSRRWLGYLARSQRGFPYCSCRPSASPGPPWHCPRPTGPPFSCARSVTRPSPGSPAGRGTRPGAGPGTRQRRSACGRGRATRPWCAPCSPTSPTSPSCPTRPLCAGVPNLPDCVSTRRDPSGHQGRFPPSSTCTDIARQSHAGSRNEWTWSHAGSVSLSPSEPSEP